MAGELCRNGAVPGRTGLFPQVNRARRLELRNCRVFPEDHLTSRSATAHIHPALFQRRGAIKLAVVCCRAAASFGEVCRQGEGPHTPEAVTGSCLTAGRRSTSRPFQLLTPTLFSRPRA